jgi:hypothetical protein
MMLHPTGIRILKKSVNMIEPGGKSQSASRRSLKSRGLGELKIPVGTWHILPSQEQYETDFWLGCRVLDVEKKKQRLITRITTSLLKLCGFAPHVTSNGIKN